jgi:hypothetical protein
LAIWDWDRRICAHQPSVARKFVFPSTPVSRKSSHHVHVLGLSNDGIPDDMVIECELAFAFLSDIKKITLSIGCRALFPRREGIVVATPSIDAVGEGFSQAGRHVQSFSLGDVPERVVNSATSQA